LFFAISSLVNFVSYFSQSHVYDVEEGDWVMKSMTNRAMLESAFTTHTYKNAYVYADFSYEHCEKEGITFKKVSKKSQTSA